MNILMIGWGFGDTISGGMDVHITSLVKNMCSLGAQIHLFLPEHNAEESSEKNLVIHKIGIDASKKDMLELIREYNDSIIKSAEDLGIDAIHTHDWFGVIAAKNIKDKKNIPWIHTVHSLEYMRCGKDKISTTEISELEKKAIDCSDALITVSNIMKKEIIRHYDIPGEKINVIYNYTTGIPKKSQPPQEHSPRVLCVSRLTFQKGIEHLIYASRSILKELPECRFSIIGDGHLKDSLERFAEILSVSSSFDFHGFVPTEELSTHFNSADIFIMPSVHEPFGIACLDAIDFSLPVILSENVGAKELFGSHIRLHRPRSSSDIAEKIVDLLRDRKLQQTLKEGAKKRLEEIDDWGAIAKKTLEIYPSA